MVKLKQLTLKNFGGYRNSTFDFSDGENIKNFGVLYGPNGTGKSTLLVAVNILCNAARYENRDCSLLFNKHVLSNNYDPTSHKYKAKLQEMKKEFKESEIYSNLKEEISEDENQMYVEGIFATDDGDKKVAINNNSVVINELPIKHNGHAYFINADSPVEMSKFQIEELKGENGESSLADMFLTLAEIVYDYPCYFDKSISSGGKEFFTDFVIEKFGTHVHYKSMSDGEKKISTMLRGLADGNHILNTDIVLIDNMAMHIYFDRHPRMFDAMVRLFPSYQFIVTTHSGIMINHIKEKHEGKYLYDLWEYKTKEFKEFNITENINKG